MRKLYCWILGLSVYTVTTLVAGPIVAFFAFYGVALLLGDYYDA